MAVFHEDRNTHRFYYNLPARTTVFQAEVFAITEAAKFIQALPHRLDTEILTDSQAAFKALAKKTVTSISVKNCVTELNKAADIRKVMIRWVRAHVGYPGNELADELAKHGAMHPPDAITILEIPLSPAGVRRAIKDHLLAKWTDRWQQRTDCRQTKQWLVKPDWSVAKKFLSMTRLQLSAVVQIITGHNFMNRHQAVVGDTDDPDCRLCLEDEETSFHVVAECPALAEQRLLILGDPFLKTPLIWSDQMATFLSGRSISRLLGLEDSEAPALEVGADDPRGVD